VKETLIVRGNQGIEAIDLIHTTFTHLGGDFEVRYRLADQVGGSLSQPDG
jgi:hypothetical protein